MKCKRIISLSFMFALSAGVFTTFVLSPRAKEPSVTFATYTNHDADTYYNGIDESKSGNNLLKDLRSLNLTRRKTTVGYGAMGTSPSGQFKYTDYDPNYVEYDENRQPYGTRISSFYTYTSATSWNREHVWPNSHGGGKKGDAGNPLPDDDIHMPRPTIAAENSSRGNSFYVEGMNSDKNGWDPYTAGYSKESRGEAARITFYCTLVNEKLILASSNLTPTGSDPITGQAYGSGHTMGNLITLLKWNIEHPVTQRELNRNEGAEYLQGNRNPFIDHPEYACKIWGNANAQTKAICGGQKITISQTSASMTVGNTLEISASTSASEVTWSSSNESVVTLNKTTTAANESIVLTAVSAGTSTVKAKVVVDDQEYTATCNVTVNSVVHVSSITLDKTELTLKLGESYQLTATVGPEDAANKEVTWAPLSHDVAFVNTTGKVFAKGLGTSNVTVTTVDGGYTATCVVKVVSSGSSGGCGGNIATTSIVLSTLSMLGIGLLLIKRKFTK